MTPGTHDDLEARMSVAAVAAQVERMLGIRPSRVAPIIGGADASSRLARADLPVGAPCPSVVYKAYDDALKYQREAGSLAFVNRLGDFAPRVLAKDDNELSLVMELIPGATLYDLDRGDAERAVLVAVEMLAQFHCIAAQHLPVFGAAHGDKPPQWDPPGTAELVAAWVRAVRALTRSDTARARFVRRAFDADINICCHYDLTLNTAELATEEAAEIILLAARRKAARREVSAEAPADFLTQALGFRRRPRFPRVSEVIWRHYRRRT